MGVEGKPGQRPDGSARRTKENHSISTHYVVWQRVDNKKSLRRASGKWLKQPVGRLRECQI